jgi:hypothetical protein
MVKIFCILGSEKHLRGDCLSKGGSYQFVGKCWFPGICYNGKEIITSLKFSTDVIWHSANNIVIVSVGLAPPYEKRQREQKIKSPTSCRAFYCFFDLCSVTL